MEVVGQTPSDNGTSVCCCSVKNDVVGEALNPLDMKFNFVFEFK